MSFAVGIMYLGADRANALYLEMISRKRSTGVERSPLDILTERLYNLIPSYLYSKGILLISASIIMFNYSSGSNRDRCLKYSSSLSTSSNSISTSFLRTSTDDFIVSFKCEGAQVSMSITCNYQL